MNNGTQQEKRAEYIGDGLLTFLIRDILCSDDQICRAEGRRIEQVVKTNKFLAGVGRKFNMKMQGNDLAFAAAVEIEIYNLYKYKGLDAARNFVAIMIKMC